MNLQSSLAQIIQGLQSQAGVSSLEELNRLADERSAINDQHRSNPLMWTPEQIAQYQRDGINPYPGYAIFPGTKYVTNPVSGEQEMVTDYSGGWSSGGFPDPKEDTGFDEIAQGLTKGTVAAGLAVGAGAALGVGSGAGAAGAGEGGAAATGIDASTGLYAGESATSGAAGTGAGGGVVSGGGGSATLASTAGSDTGASMPAAQAESPFGDFQVDPETGDVFSGTGDSPGLNFQGGNSNDFFTGTETAPGQVAPGVLEQMKQQALDMAKTFGITPASALQSILKAAGRAAPAALGVIGANRQANSLEALANKYLDMGAPSRARYEASFAPGFTLANEPGYMDALNQTSKATLHGLSVQGNPAGSPNAWNQTLSDINTKFSMPALQNFRNMNANAGGIASLQTSAPGFDTGAVNAGKGVFDAIGGGLNDIFNPKPSLAQTLADYKRLLGTA